MLDFVSNSPWFPIGLSLAMAVGFSSYILYCLKNGRLLGGNKLFGRQWIYRDEEPLCFWFYIALYLFFDGVAIYEFIMLSCHFGKGLPLKS